jgi:MoaA/NifB/PqqE/SkfB family radical SAM enzyme
MVAGRVMRSGAAVASALATTAWVRLGEVTNRTFTVPLVIFYPTSRCNSHCVSCDWWRSSGATDLRFDEIARLAQALQPLGTRVVAFSGGEPLLRHDVFEVARLFRREGLALHLLTSGVLLERCADEVASEFTRVIVSLDAPTEMLYHAVRGIRALGVVEEGVAKLRSVAPRLPVTARATLHKLNFRELPRLIEHAKAMAFDGISFLPADVSSTAFGRHALPPVDALVLDAAEIAEFESVVERTIADHQDDFESRFVMEPPDKLRRLPRYYAALAGIAPFPPVSCNAPWTSVVIEADGSVRPCFFHEAIGNIRITPLDVIVTRDLPGFRRTLDVSTNPVCTRCVCSIKTGWRGAPWQ